MVYWASKCDKGISIEMLLVFSTGNIIGTRCIEGDYPRGAHWGGGNLAHDPRLDAWANSPMILDLVLRQIMGERQWCWGK